MTPDELLHELRTVLPGELLRRLDAVNAAVDAAVDGGAASNDDCWRVELDAVVEDSRAVQPGVLFIARRGDVSDGRRFLSAAIDAGAAAILTHDDEETRALLAQLSSESDAWRPLPIFVSSDIGRAAAHVAERVAGHPSSVLEMVGVTGTNGKTTIAHLVRSLLRHSKRRCGLIGTVEVDDGQNVWPASLTTPPATEISRVLRRMVRQGVQSCAMEVSSHALAQGRADAIDFDVAVYSNLSGDHMDYHGTEADYIAAKARLFSGLNSDATAIVNADDPVHAEMIRETRARVLRCGLSDTAGVDCSAKVYEQTIRRTQAVFTGPWGVMDVSLPLTGRHNVMNLLQAVAACWALGVSREELTSGVRDCSPPPGRFESVTAMHDPFTVLVDYAHTDDALSNALGALRPLVPEGGRLHVLFGCGGDRDRTKRPRMAGVACSLADVIHVTSDNPRSEDPMSIIEDVLSGVPMDRRSSVAVDPDRAASIERMIRDARPDDVLLIAGKGHEDYQIIGSERRDFDDRVEARRALVELLGPDR